MKYEITNPCAVEYKGKEAITFKCDGKDYLVSLEYLEEKDDLLIGFLGKRMETFGYGDYEKEEEVPNYLSSATPEQLTNIVIFLLDNYYLLEEELEDDYKAWFRTEAKKRLIRMTMRRITYPYKKQIHEVQN